VVAARHRSKDVLLFRQGDINLIVNREPSSFARSFATVHGTSVCALSFRVSDSQHIHNLAVQAGSHDFQGRIGPGELVIPAIRTEPGYLIYFVDRFGEKGTIYDTDFAPIAPAT
jgi:4-hydroxyphenylpyruvate dioxygenase